MPTPTCRAGSPGLLLMLVVCVGTAGCLVPVGLMTVPTQTGRGRPCIGLGFAQIPFSLLGLGNSPVMTGNSCSGSGTAEGMPISFIKFVNAVLPQLRRARLCKRALVTRNAKPDGRRDKREWWRGQTSGGDGKKVGTGISRAFKASQQLEDVVELKKKGGSSRPTIDDEGDWSGVYEGAPRSKKVPEFKYGERDSTGESFWLEYQMRVLCDTPQAAPFKPPTQAIDALDARKAHGEINEADYNAQKKTIVGSFWSSLLGGDDARRTMKPRDILVQITNDPEFANSWAERKVLAAGLQDLGVSVQWVPVSRKPGDKKGSTRKSRHRISLLQLATKDEVLIMQMAHMQPSRVPDMVKEILSDRNVVKHGFRLLDSAIKIERDWDVRISPRVECSEYASSLRYLSKDACEVATSVLALNYSKPEWIPRSNWEAVTLSDMQITCAALDAWVAREATLYMQGVSKTRPIQDFSSPGAALAQKGILEGKSSGGERQQGMPSHSYEDREPDKILYIPKVDLREGGSYAYWLWRGTMVSDKHIEQYCGVHLELDDTESATVAALWGDKRAISEAVAYMENLLARSQLESKYNALGLGPPHFINRPDENGKMTSLVVINTMEVVEWSFFPTTLTKSYQGKPMVIRGRGWKKDVARAVFFSQADAAAQAAKDVLGNHRPKMIHGPLPGGLDPALMWRTTGYTL